MIYKKDPKDTELFSRADYLISEPAIELLRKGWHGVFRTSVLELLPVESVEKKFSPDMGRPTKELFSMIGLIIIKEFFGWTEEQTILEYMTNLGIQYALNVEVDKVSLSKRTLQRYIKMSREESVSQKTMIDITRTFLKNLNICIKEQRLDSTHIFSNMAHFSRRQLLFTIIQRFLVQVKRHNPEKYDKLPNEITSLYVKNTGWIFAETSPMKTQRNGKIFTSAEQLGYDMQRLIERFGKDEEFNNRTTYLDLVRVFEEQFEMNDGKAEFRKKTNGKILLNPSDRDAEVGHKGVGYQAQISETCSPENPVQMIVTAKVEGASSQDQASFSDVVEKLKEEDHLPETLFADKGYGSDKNYVSAQNMGVDLCAPAPGGSHDKKGLDDCEFDENYLMVKCPAGHRPMKNKRSKNSYYAIFHIDVCNKCPFKDICASQKYGKNNRQFQYDEIKLRSYNRRKNEASAQFKEKYKKRIGIEGLNGRLKQFTPLRRVRARGKLAIDNSVYSILAMHNIKQAARYAQIVEKIG